ncbi:hypothetical protein HYDPIDRAFT_35864 [Hydnomerulius pinastri MD-312]|nr:hypothetical protein HYDPIDRAFT_35864 [Hydnomerulius pinastri MD-312]
MGLSHTPQQGSSLQLEHTFEVTSNNTRLGHSRSSSGASSVNSDVDVAPHSIMRQTEHRSAARRVQWSTPLYDTRIIPSRHSGLGGDSSVVDSVEFNQHSTVDAGNLTEVISGLSLNIRDTTLHQSDGKVTSPPSKTAGACDVDCSKSVPSTSDSISQFPLLRDRQKAQMALQINTRYVAAYHSRSAQPQKPPIHCDGGFVSSVLTRHSDAVSCETIGSIRAAAEAELDAAHQHLLPIPSQPSETSAQPIPSKNICLISQQAQRGEVKKTKVVKKYSHIIPLSDAFPLRELQPNVILGKRKSEVREDDELEGQCSCRQKMNSEGHSVSMMDQPQAALDHLEKAEESRASNGADAGVTDVRPIIGDPADNQLDSVDVDFDATRANLSAFTNVPFVRAATPFPTRVNPHQPSSAVAPPSPTSPIESTSPVESATPSSSSSPISPQDSSYPLSQTLIACDEPPSPASGDPVTPVSPVTPTRATHPAQPTPRNKPVKRTKPANLFITPKKVDKPRTSPVDKPAHVVHPRPQAIVGAVASSSRITLDEMEVDELEDGDQGRENTSLKGFKDKVQEWSDALNSLSKAMLLSELFGGEPTPKLVDLLKEIDQKKNWITKDEVHATGLSKYIRKVLKSCVAMNDEESAKIAVRILDNFSQRFLDKRFPSEH